MRRRLITFLLALVGIGASIAAVLVVLVYLSEPPTAACNAQAAGFGHATTLLTHQEVLVHCTCEGAVQAGTLYLPSKPGPHPAVIWIHGAGPERRLGYAGALASLVDAGVAVYSYDKRGVGETQGSCCPGDNGHFNLLSADIAGAVAALASIPDVRKDEIGLIGASQAGWIAPKAAAMSGQVAFIALARSTPVTERLPNLYERLARGDEGQLSKEEISRRLASAGPSGFDPVPYLRQTTAPSLWMLGTEDDRIPVPETITLLGQLKNEGKDIEIVTFPGARHGLLDQPPSAKEAPQTLVDWIVKL